MALKYTNPTIKQGKIVKPADDDDVDDPSAPPARAPAPGSKGARIIASRLNSHAIRTGVTNDEE
jgi:hypothetical protein